MRATRILVANLKLFTSAWKEDGEIQYNGWLSQLKEMYDNIKLSLLRLLALWMLRLTFAMNSSNLYCRRFAATDFEGADNVDALLVIRLTGRRIWQIGGRLDSRLRSVDEVERRVDRWVEKMVDYYGCI